MCVWDVGRDEMRRDGNEDHGMEGGNLKVERVLFRLLELW